MLVGMGQWAGQRDGGARQGPAFLVGPAASLSTLGGRDTFFSALLLPAPDNLQKQPYMLPNLSDVGART